MEDKEVVYIHCDFHFFKIRCIEMKGEKRQFDMVSNCR